MAGDGAVPAAAVPVAGLRTAQFDPDVALRVRHDAGNPVQVPRVRLDPDAGETGGVGFDAEDRREDGWSSMRGSPTGSVQDSRRRC